ncbi:MAG: Fe-S oxidoreductase [Pelagibacterales bacterium]|nr:Fe-S oxidoreductase [Pelagibacterales bacterium]|tara:strand:- start:3383 stop:4684 length:1302 start_codon:yes stop_codon:yes gene_type:complete
MEGGLQKPTRYDIDWQNPDYLNEELFEKELRRVSDVCHGCRRCVNLCNSFPTLFDLIDESKTFEVDGVAYEQFGSVVDHCYLCDLCFMTKCPYVPPHEWEIDFPHLMLRGKAIKFNKSKTSFRDKLLTSTDLLGKLGSRKIIAPIINFFNNIKIFRILLEKILGIHRNAKLPKFSSYTAKVKYSKLKFDKKSKNKVAIYTTCYHNYNEPNVIDDLVLVLNHNDIDIEIIRDDKCCGMPKLELGDLETVNNMMQHNLKKFKRYVDNGYTIIAPVPSCVLMFKQELPLLFPDNKDVRLVSKSICDPFEYLLKLHENGSLKTNFKNDLGSVFYQVACHQRVQNIGQVTKKVLELVPNTNINALERCSGHDGTYGVKKETHNIAIKIALPITREYIKTKSTQFTSDCTLAAHHVVNAMGNKVMPTHPITLMKNAYGI